MTRLRLLALTLAAGFTACLNTTAPQWATVENATFAPALGVDLAHSTSTDAGVYFRDITVGTGPTIVPAQESYMYYREYLSTGVEIDSVLPPNPPVAFQTGTGTLPPGFEIGLQNMNVGGRRQIIVPPALAYGLGDVRDSNGNVVVPGNSVIVYLVDLTDAAGSTVAAGALVAPRTAAVPHTLFRARR